MTEHRTQKGTDPASGSLDATLQPADLPPQPTEPLPPDRFESGVPDFEGFEVVRELGKGAFARVYLARERELDRLVALKVSVNFSHEARTLASLEHDHIVRVHSEQLDTRRNLRLMCMQYVAGATLARVIGAIGSVPPDAAGQAILDLVDAQNADQLSFDRAAWRDRDRLATMNLVEVVCWMGARLAEALAYAHQRHVLHRDIKPANILVNGSGRPLLADFNVSASCRPRSASKTAGVMNEEIDGRESVGGTLAYMAPEHIDAFNPDNFTPPEAVDERSDIFSLGVVLYEMLTGRLPFEQNVPVDHRDTDTAEDSFLQNLADSRRNGPRPLPASLGARHARKGSGKVFGRETDGTVHQRSRSCG